MRNAKLSRSRSSLTLDLLGRHIMEVYERVKPNNNMNPCVISIHQPSFLFRDTLIFFATRKLLLPRQVFIDIKLHHCGSSTESTKLCQLRNVTERATFLPSSLRLWYLKSAVHGFTRPFDSHTPWSSFFTLAQCYKNVFVPQKGEKMNPVRSTALNLMNCYPWHTPSIWSISPKFIADRTKSCQTPANKIQPP